MPASPRGPVPRRMRWRIVSAWSSRVCPTATAPAPALAGDLRQPIVAGAAGVGFEVGCAGRLPLAQVHRQAQRARQLGHERRIAAGGRSAHAVVEMGDRQAEAERLGDLAKDPQETHAVATSGDGDHPNATDALIEPALDSAFDALDPVAWSR